MENNIQEAYIERCFELALMGESSAYPNPIVGSVIVHNGKIIGEGFHERYGQAHAEVNAVNSVIYKYPDTYKTLLRESDIYVSLEPCNHHGKTPPCTELIKKYKFKRLIFAINDPNPDLNKSREKAYQEIEANGTEIILPERLSEAIKQKAYYINRVFFHSLTEKSPWITIKIASYQNGSMLTRTDDLKITNNKSLQEVHRMRSCHDLLITGINSIKKDNSKLNIRYSKEELGLQTIKQPQILILKSRQDFSDDERDKLNVFKNKNLREIRVNSNLKELISEIGTNSKAKRIMLEAGQKLLDSFLAENLFNEIIHFIRIEDSNLSQEKIFKISQDFLEIYQEKSKLDNYNLILVKTEIKKAKFVEEHDNLKLSFINLNKTKFKLI